MNLSRLSNDKAIIVEGSSSSCCAAGTDIPDPHSPLADLQVYIPYPHIAAGCMFELVVLLLPGHMWGSIGIHHLVVLFNT